MECVDYYCEKCRVTGRLWLREQPPKDYPCPKCGEAVSVYNPDAASGVPKTETSYTKGPWDIVPLAHCQAIQAGPDNRICTLWDHVDFEGAPCGSIESQNKTQEEIDANARLLAAAPTLYEALKACLPAVEFYVDYSGKDQVVLHDAREALRMVEGDEWGTDEPSMPE